MSLTNCISKKYPLTDLHRHIEGSARISTILELSQQFNMKLPADSIEGLKPFVQCVDLQPDLLAFLEKLDWAVKVLGDLDACRRLAYENVEDVYRAGIAHTELRFSPYYMAMFNQLPLEGVVEAVIDGINTANRDFGLNTKLIGIMSRTFGIEKCQQELDAILAYKDEFVALDLAGDELGFPGELFVPHFNKIKGSGLNITVHAGESAGAQSIWQAITELGATRIGHGVRAIEDPKLMDYLAKHQIGMESCITSNILTSTVADFSVHPVKAFLEHDILVSLNTDDPTVEGTELPNEYKMAIEKVGLTQAQLEKAQQNGMKMAFLSDSERAEITKSFI